MRTIKTSTRVSRFMAINESLSRHANGSVECIEGDAFSLLRNEPYAVRYVLPGYFNWYDFFGDLYLHILQTGFGIARQGNVMELRYQPRNAADSLLRRITPDPYERTGGATGLVIMPYRDLVDRLGYPHAGPERDRKVEFSWKFHKTRNVNLGFEVWSWYQGPATDVSELRRGKRVSTDGMRVWTTNAHTKDQRILLTDLFGGCYFHGITSPASPYFGV